MTAPLTALTATTGTGRAFAHGLVVGKFYPVHAGHLNLVRTALARCARVTVQVLVSTQESIPGELRAQWIRDELPQAHVLVGLDDEPVDYDSNEAWDAHVAVMQRLLAEAGRGTDPHGTGDTVDAVFTSDVYGAELARRFDAAWVQVDPGRIVVSVSGSAVRADPGAHWWSLPAGVRAWFARRVVVLGAESTGTTTLAQDLQRHYGLPPVVEFGREWSEIRPGGLAAPWHSAEFDLVAREQSRIEDAAAARTPRPLLVCDTDVLATTLWHERYVGTVSPSVVALAAARVPDLYLLTGDEIPFVQDGMRDGEHIRSQMQAAFRSTLKAQADAGGAPWVELRGSRAARLAGAVELVDALCAEPRTIADPMPQVGQGLTVT
ncbi:AAA family ATPase [Sanguibacter sp. 25GB23B1]|uniref:AAA family ATPase n=1 Tax=unclassified Sanguibacter TaxID=2645534 RepID=UPI0032AF5905